MRFPIQLAERGVIPDRFIRWGIQMLLRMRLAQEARREAESGDDALR